jgi:hypothetical protein
MRLGAYFRIIRKSFLFSKIILILLGLGPIYWFALAWIANHTLNHRIAYPWPFPRPTKTTPIQCLSNVRKEIGDSCLRMRIGQSHNNLTHALAQFSIELHRAYI